MASKARLGKQITSILSKPHPPVVLNNPIRIPTKYLAKMARVNYVIGA